MDRLHVLWVFLFVIFEDVSFHVLSVLSPPSFFFVNIQTTCRAVSCEKKRKSKYKPALEKQNVKKSHPQREPVDRVPKLFTATVGSGHLGAASLNHDVCKYCTFNRLFFRGSQKTLVFGFTSIDS